MVIMSWKSTFMVPRLCAGAISARYRGATCTRGSPHLSSLQLNCCQAPHMVINSVKGVVSASMQRTSIPHTASIWGGDSSLQVQHFAAFARRHRTHQTRH